jgi:hypothetical protein
VRGHGAVSCLIKSLVTAVVVKGPVKRIASPSKTLNELADSAVALVNDLPTAPKPFQTLVWFAKAQRCDQIITFHRLLRGIRGNPLRGIGA